MKKLFLFLIVFGGIGGGLYFSGGHKMILEQIGMGSDDDDEEYEESEDEYTDVVEDIAPVEASAPAAPTVTREYWEKPGFNRWSQYKKILVDKVQIRGNNGAMSARDQEMLGEYFYNAMRNAVSRQYQIASGPGPNVLRVKTTIEDVTSSGGSQGSVTMKGRIMDSRTGTTLVRIKDSKTGSIFSSTAIWGDITKGFDNWANQLYGLLRNKLGTIKYAASNTIDKKLLTILRAAEQDLFEKRLTSPPGKNALNKYRQALLIDPENPQAIKGIEKIVKKYASWGERAIMEGNTDKAWRYLEKGRDILDEHPAIKNLHAAIRRSYGAGGVQTMVTSPSMPMVAAEPMAAEPDPSTAEPAMAEEPAKAAIATAEEAPAAAPAVPVPAAPAANDPWGGKPGAGSASFSGAKLKPFMLGLETDGDINAIASAAKTRLKSAGFEIAGEYSPYSGTHIIVVTNDTLKSTAAKSEMGGFGAMVRISIAKVGERVQVAFTNPIYLEKIYRMKGSLSSVASKLGSALGHEKTFGSKKGLKTSKMRKWHYMIGMPYFDDLDKLGKGSHASMVSKIAGKLGGNKVYQIDIPGKNETVFGVKIGSGKGSDATVMTSINTGGDSHAAHLPYEIVVANGKAYALNGKFRIALSFPDLTMGQFASIKSAPGAIERNLKKYAK